MKKLLFLQCCALLAACGPTQSRPDVEARDTGAFDAAAPDGESPNEDGAVADADPLPSMPLPPRMPGQRAPLSASCDPADPARCLLPWPSNTFTRVDMGTATGLRLAVSSQRLGGGDDATSLNRADGFSRVTPIVTVVSGVVDPASLGAGTTAIIRLVKASGSGVGTLVPLRLRAIESRTSSRPETAVLAYPLTPLDASSDYVAVLMDDVRTTDGPGPTQDAIARASLALAQPTTGTEARLAAYHAPSRAALMAAGVDFSKVIRVWDFTTRSDADPLRTLRSMRETMISAVMANRYSVTITTATAPMGGDIAVIVEGRLTGLPDFVDRTARVLARNADGTPRMTGVHDVPFRVTIPRGTGSYRPILFGHGLGGDYNDDSFDAAIGGAGAAKVSVRFTGLTGSDVLDTIGGLNRAAAGSEWAAALIQQSMADLVAVQRSLAGQLGMVLASPTIGTIANPASGRRLDTTRQVWAGGSLGGTLGLVYAHLESEIAGAALNVPGAGWAGYLVLSSVFSLGRGVLLATYRNDVNLQLAVAITQTNFDAMDGANWATSAMARDVPMVIQQSMGDPVLPAPGTEMVATVARARQLGAALSPVHGVVPETDGEVLNGASFTQFRVPARVTGAYDVHGFGARDTIAGDAAREQIFAFLQSVWMGAPRSLTPSYCVVNMPMNSCDFASSP
jgi:hypothetical protein